jgi:hypothetical protein
VGYVFSLLLLVAAIGGVASLGGQERPLPDEDALFRDARENIARATRLQSGYAYKERRTELHMNPFGRLGTGATLLYEVTPTEDGAVTLRTLLERDGKPVPRTAPERRERRARTQRRSGMDDAVATLRFAIDRRDRLNGRETIVVRFEPRPDAKPETREGRIAKVMRGTIWVDEEAREVIRVEAVATDDLSFGLGVVARLNEGTRVELTREPVSGGIWLPTSIRFMGQGRAMLFRRLDIDHVIEWFDYREVAGLKSGGAPADHLRGLAAPTNRFLPPAADAARHPSAAAGTTPSRVRPTAAP